MKGILGDIGVMRIPLKADAKSVKQQVQQAREKAWHDRYIKNKTFKEGDLVLLYYSKFAKFPGKFCMHWLGPYQVKHVTSGGTV